MKYLKGMMLSLVIFSSFKTLQGQDIYKLWEQQGRPHYKANNLEEYEDEAYGTKVIYNVSDPTLTVFKARRKNTGKAIVICPGGGYTHEAIYHEGYYVARALTKMGITGAVLKYRLPNSTSSDSPGKVPLADARRALKLLRDNAYQYGIDPEMVGIMGFSAGSHLATMVSLWKSEDPDENPDFSVLVYGVTDDKPDNIKWLEESLFHRSINEEELKQLRFLQLVDKNTPPAFLVHAYDDDVCHVSESTLYAEKLFVHEVPVEMHLFSIGGHGFGLGRKEDGTNVWLPLLVNWLKRDLF